MSGTILLADDSLTIQKVVELTFADTGHTVVTVSSGDELLEQLPGVRPDLVICDVVMPGTDGYSVCQTLKSDPETLHIPVVLLTGTFEPFDRDRALAAGCDEIITKPFEARKLVAAVESLLQPAEEPTDEAVPPPAIGEGGRFEGAVAPPSGVSAPPPTIEEFGTRLASPTDVEEPGAPSEAPAWTAPEPPEEITFTTTGFADMEAPGTAEEAAEPTPPAFPEAVPPPVEGVADEAFEFPAMDLEESQAPEVTPEAGMPAIEPETEPFAAPVEEPAADAWDSEPAAAEPAAPEPAPPEGAATGADAAEEPFAPPEEPEPPVGSVTTPVVMPTIPPAPEPPVEPAPEVAAATPADMAPSEPAEAAPARRLSDEDVERIARRVVELFAERLEQIAWEVVPDMAEIVVRERIRRLEAEVEESRPDATH